MLLKIFEIITDGEILAAESQKTSIIALKAEENNYILLYEHYFVFIANVFIFNWCD